MLSMRLTAGSGGSGWQKRRAEQHSQGPRAAAAHLDALEERDCLTPVDQAVVVRERQVHDWPARGKEKVTAGILGLMGAGGWGAGL